MSGTGEPSCAPRATPLRLPLSISHVWSLVALDARFFEVTVSLFVSHCLIHCSGMERGLCPVAVSLKGCSWYSCKVNLHPSEIHLPFLPSHFRRYPSCLFTGARQNPPSPSPSKYEVAGFHASSWKLFSITLWFLPAAHQYHNPNRSLCFSYGFLSFIGNLN